jgi:RHS repeat-associated protein
MNRILSRILALMLLQSFATYEAQAYSRGLGTAQVDRDGPDSFGGAAGVGSLYEMHARYYDAELKRFATEDPIGLQGGLNLYVYGSGNPLAFLDPFGLCGDVWFDRLGNWAQSQNDAAVNWNNNNLPWGIAGTLNTVNQIAYGAITTPQAIGHLGEAEAHYWDDPTLDNLAAVYADISLAAGLVAAGAAPAAGVRNTNPFTGPVSDRVFIVNPNGNVVVVNPGQSLTGSANGLWLQVRQGSTTGPFTGMRLDNQPAPHAHVPGVGNHLPAH